MADIKELTEKTITTFREDGITAVAKKAKNLVQMSIIEGKDAKNKIYKDVLFINGCDESVPHPARESSWKQTMCQRIRCIMLTCNWIRCVFTEHLFFLDVLIRI